MANIKLNFVDCNKILDTFGELTVENYQINMLKMFDIYYDKFKKQNPKLYEIKTHIKWGTHKFKNLGECICELDLAIQNCDGSEQQRYNNDLDKIIKLYNSGKLTDNVIVLNS